MTLPAQSATSSVGAAEAFALLGQWVDVPLCLVDGQQTLIAANTLYCDLVGQPLSALTGLAVQDVIGQANWNVTQPYLMRAFAGEHLIITLARVGASRGKGASSIEFRPYRDYEGLVRGVFIAIREALDPSGHHTASIQTVPQPIGFFDRAGQLVWSNSALDQFLTLHHVPGSETGTEAPDIQNALMQFSISEPLSGALARALAGRQSSVELPFEHADGSPRWMRIDLSPADSTQTLGVYAVLIDIQASHMEAMALHDSEVHFRSFTENIPEAIAFIDLERHYRYANHAFAHLVDLPREAIVGRHVAEIIGEEIANERQQLFERAITGETVSLEALVNVAGRMTWREIRYLPYRDEQGEVEGVYVVSRDIDAAKRAQFAAREQEASIRLLTDNVPAQISYLGPDDRYKYCNLRFLEDNGLTEEQVLGHTPAEVFDDDSEGEFEQYRQAAKRGEPVQFERRSGPHAANPRWWRISMLRDLDEHGALRGLYDIAHDITETRIAQDRLIQQQQWIEAFIENFPQPLTYVDPRSVYRYANRAFAQLIGMDRKDIIGHTAEKVLPDDVVEMLRDGFIKAMKGETARAEHRMLHHTGTHHRWIAVDWLPDIDENGAVRGLYSMAQDISDAKKAQLDYEESVREMQRAMDSVALPISYVDAEQRLRFVNRTSTVWYGRSTGELIGTAVADLMSDEDYRFAQPYIEAALAGNLVQYEREMRYHDGIRRWVLLRYVPTRDDSGRVTGFYTTATDIQARKKQELALQQANWLLTAHFENTPLASFTLDADLRVTRWSSQAEMLFNWRRDDVLERPFWDLGLVEEKQREDFFPNDTAGGAPNSRQHLVRAKRRDGKEVSCEWHIAALRDPRGRITSILGLVQDVSQRVESENRLREIAQRDTLTKLLNRNALEPTLRGFIERAKINASGVAILFIDLDHFKNINDTLGHRIGDLMLIEIARTLQRCVAPLDEVARIGGDEFMVIIGHERPKAIAHETAQRIITALRDPIEVENQRLSVAASIGVAVYPDHGRAPEALLRSADLAMYKAKENGKNRFEFFSASLAQRSERRTAVKNALRLALQRDALKLYYQPRVGVANGRMVGAEALLRWTDPRLGVVTPKEFITIAEESGLIHELGLFVFRKACRQIRSWQDRSIPMGILSVNFSAHQLLVATFIDEVDRVIEETGCDPRWIEVEITETSMLFDLGITKTVIADLKHRGMQIAIDDFGTGFSSLSHLQQLDIDTLKIDQSFIRDMLDDEGDCAITKSVISLGRGLGLSVTAEGVENERQLAILREAGCDYFQGFLFSPAVAVEDLEMLLIESSKLAA